MGGGEWKFLQKLIIGGLEQFGEGGGVKNSTIFFLVPMFITMFIRSNIILTTYIIKANVYIYVNLYVS